MITTENSNKSRFGYHPCSYETFAKIKEIHKAYWKALKDFHRWNRWNRKQPQNRFGIEPKYNDLFVVNKTWMRVTTMSDGHDRIVLFSKTVVDYGIMELYRQARIPMPEPVEMFSQEQLDTIEKVYSDLK